MSFGRRHPTHKQQTSLKSLQLKSQQLEPSQLVERYGKRLVAVEHNLNAICSQHDALMPLLTLLDSMPHLSKSDIQIRAYMKKVMETQSRLERLEQSFRESRGREALEGVEQSFGSVSRSLADCKEAVSHLELASSQQSNSLAARHSSSVVPLTEDIDRRVDANRKEIQSMLADFKNQIELQHRKHLQSIKSLTLPPEEQSKLLSDPPFAHLCNELRNLYREIAMVRVELPPSNLMEFHNYNFSRIGYELYEIEEIIGGIYNQGRAASTAEFSERIDWLGYQIRGLRKKYLGELNSIALKRPINQEQEQFSHDLDSLEQRRGNLLLKIQSMQNGSHTTSKMSRDLG